MAKKKVLNPRVPRTHNGGTMTKSQFFGMLVASMRQASRWWVPAKQAKEAARKSCKKGLQKWEYLCNHCNNYYKEKEIQADHILEVGGIKDYKDIPGFVERLFCEKEGYQILCKSCHTQKTEEYMKNKRKKNNDEQ